MKERAKSESERMTRGEKSEDEDGKRKGDEG